jgi:hypothetical protein
MQHNAGKSLQTPANDLKRADKNLQNRRALVLAWLTSSLSELTTSSRFSII